ncbi:hypothetical protein CPC08DRAFT_710633 [Agrocybe pediades]|nr:hypothetical protein CPC08DRAFT_710633 [Agrocybe pediades]
MVSFFAPVVLSVCNLVCSTVVEDEKTSKGTHPVFAIMALILFSKSMSVVRLFIEMDSSIRPEGASDIPRSLSFKRNAEWEWWVRMEK